MSLASTTVPSPGQLVTVRQRRWVVTTVDRNSLPPGPPGPGGSDVPGQHLVSLSSVEDDGLGEELQVVWEIEPGTEIQERAALPEPTGFDDPRRLDAFLDAIRWGAVSSADLKALHAPFRSGVAIEDYQLDPVVRALQMPRVNLLVADDVGLGKTIEAGLVVQELLLRHRARTVLVVCPAGIQIQWREQMRDKFGLEFRIVDSALLKELRRTRGLHVNPWKHFPRLITSLDYLKRDRPLRLFREALPAEGEPAFPRRFDLLIVDEAHNVAPSGAGRYAMDSQRTHAIRAIVPHFEHRLFLSATPHNGYVESFSALLELIDDQRFHRGVKPDREQLHAIMVRRMKSELPPLWDGTPRFPKRDIVAIEVDYPEAERAAHLALKRYSELRQERSKTEIERVATEFVLKLLKKRLFSSPAAFRATLAQHERSIAAGGPARAPVPAALGALEREIEEVDEDAADDEAWEEAAADVVTSASRAQAEVSNEERGLLAELRRFAADTSCRPDAKAARLIAWLHEHLKPGGRWSDTRAIVFTEYRATQKWLQGLLAAEGLAQDGRLEVLHGGLAKEDREPIKAAFQASPDDAKVRILLATDAASEGIDLQNHCSRLIHYEIPWNPNRLEQRNGRIDRHGQRAKEVLVHHFVGKGYDRAASVPARRPGDLEGDLEFLLRTAVKVEAIREDLGKVGVVIAQQVQEAMLGRRQALDTAAAEKAAEPARRVLRLEQKIREDLARLAARLRETREDLRLSPENIRSVVEIGLTLAGQPPLVPAAVPGIWPDPTGTRAEPVAFHVPALRGTWARATEGLEHPHTRKVRPVVFDHHLAEGRDDVVICHLNHRLVQLCLGLLRAEVGAPEGHGTLHRVTARLVRSQTLDAPLVVAHARLVVLGADHVRLHEEIVTVAGKIGGKNLTRYPAGKTEEALAAALPDAAPEESRQRLQALWPSHRDRLLALLEERRKERMPSILKDLEKRAEKEARDIAAVLGELKRSIEAELDVPPVQQAEFAFMTTPEREQLSRNFDSLKARAHAIPAEIEREARRLRDRYADPTPRLFPVAVTYLVPESLARAR